MKIKIFSTLFTSLIILIGIFLVYEYPIEKHMAKDAIEQYIKKQGIHEDNILSKEYMKDYKQGGYEVSIELKNDPGLTYTYNWLKKRGVVLLVSRGGAGMDSGMKYPPL